MKQARRAYVRISDPSNAALDAVNRDITDAAPLSKFRADARAKIAADRTWNSRMRAIRWPRKVQPYVTALLTAAGPAVVRCDRAIARAPSTQAADDLSFSNPGCQAWANDGNADTIPQPAQPAAEGLTPSTEREPGQSARLPQEKT